MHLVAIGTFRTWRDVRPESAMHTKADIRRLLQIYEFTPQGVAAAGKAERTMDGMKERAICPSCQSVATDVVDLDPKSKPECALSRAHQRGVSRSSRTLARDAVDASGAFDESADCGRRSRVVLTPRRWRSSSAQETVPDDGDKQARSPGRARRKPLKPLRAGMPGVAAYPW
jgi:hypothetical protein